MTTRDGWQRWIATQNTAHDRWTALEGHAIRDLDKTDDDADRSYIPITPDQARQVLEAVATLGHDLARVFASVSKSLQTLQTGKLPELGDRLAELGAAARQLTIETHGALHEPGHH